MKKTVKSIMGLSFIFFIGNSAIAQETLIRDVKPLIFNTQAEKDAWIEANPTEYAHLKNEASQISATYIGTLLQVKPEVKTVTPEGTAKKPAGIATPPNLKGFPVMENTGDAEADNLRYEEAKKEWYKNNTK